MSQKTSIEWLLEQLAKSKTLYDYDGYAIPEEFAKIIDQTEEMRKQEIITAFSKGQESMQFKFPLSAEQYYNETYNTNQYNTK
jgi:hypothetical protein